MANKAPSFPAEYTSDGQSTWFPDLGVDYKIDRFTWDALRDTPTRPVAPIPTDGYPYGVAHGQTTGDDPQWIYNYETGEYDSTEGDPSQKGATSELTNLPVQLINWINEVNPGFASTGAPTISELPTFDPDKTDRRAELSRMVPGRVNSMGDDWFTDREVTNQRYWEEFGDGRDYGGVSDELDANKPLYNPYTKSYYWPGGGDKGTGHPLGVQYWEGRQEGDWNWDEASLKGGIGEIELGLPDYAESELGVSNPYSVPYWKPLELALSEADPEAVAPGELWPDGDGGYHTFQEAAASASAAHSPEEIQAFKEAFNKVMAQKHAYVRAKEKESTWFADRGLDWGETTGPVTVYTDQNLMGPPKGDSEYGYTPLHIATDEDVEYWGRQPDAALGPDWQLEQIHNPDGSASILEPHEQTGWSGGYTTEADLPYRDPDSQFAWDFPDEFFEKYPWLKAENQPWDQSKHADVDTLDESFIDAGQEEPDEMNYDEDDYWYEDDPEMFYEDEMWYEDDPTWDDIMAYEDIDWEDEEAYYDDPEEIAYEEMYDPEDGDYDWGEETLGWTEEGGWYVPEDAVPVGSDEYTDDEEYADDEEYVGGGEYIGDEYIPPTPVNRAVPRKPPGFAPSTLSSNQRALLGSGMKINQWGEKIPKRSIKTSGLNIGPRSLRDLNRSSTYSQRTLKA